MLDDDLRLDKKRAGSRLDGEADTQLEEKTLGADATSFILEELLADTVYVITIHPIYPRNTAAPTSISGKTCKYPQPPIEAQHTPAASGHAGMKWRRDVLTVTLEPATEFYQIQGLLANTDYTVTVTTLYGRMEGPAVNTRVKTDATGDLLLRTLAISPTTIRVTWNLQLDASSYRIEWRKATAELAQSQKAVLSATTNSYDVINLSPGTEYAITLYTLYNGREVATPATMSKTVEKEILLGTVANLRAVETTGGHIRISWTGAAGATAYKVMWQDQTGYEITRVVSHDVTSFDIDRVQQGGTYFIKVSPLSGSREGNSVSIVVRADAVIEHVSEFRTLETRNNLIRITWRRVPQATAYKVTWKRADGAESSRVQIRCTPLAFRQW
ncbi:collagen alpha-1(VII) chain-like [Mustelus asterias]